ncbi:hypothetical protein ACCD08_10875 [Telluria sp. Tellsp104]
MTNGRVVRRVAGLLIGGLLLAGAARADGDVERGRRLYLDGLRADGTPLRAAGANGIARIGRDAACAACHRRSGYGSAEGPFGVPPITSADLFQDRAPVAASARIAHQLGKPARPPYDGASLRTALFAGADPAGRALGVLMPRYTLGADELRDLEAYLRTLGVGVPEGVDGEEIHFATVIQPDVVPQRRAALLAVLDTFVRDKNAAVRSEPARRSAGAMRMQRAYRKWVLHVWDLSGPPADWPGQLERYYRDRPVFALVSGIGDGDWAPIHRFSERRRVPCILPVAMLPALGEPDFYTLYFSGGLLLEAEGLGRSLAVRGGRVRQVYRAGDDAARAAARALRAALTGSGTKVDDEAVAGAPDKPLVLGGGDDTAVVSWLRPDDLASARAGPAPVYLAQALVPRAPPGWTEAPRVTRWEPDVQRAVRLRRVRDWLAARRLALVDEEVQVNAWFAMSMLGEALMHIMDSFSREYLLEQVEHNVNVTILPSMYPRLSVGRDMRVAAHEVYIGDDGHALTQSGTAEVAP